MGGSSSLSCSSSSGMGTFRLGFLRVQLLLLLPQSVVAGSLRNDANSDEKCGKGKAKTAAVRAPRLASTSTSSASSCGLYWAPSLNQYGEFSLYSGEKIKKGDRVGPGEPLIPMMDVNKNEWSPWHEFVWDPFLLPALLMENDFLSNIYVPGIASLATCSGAMADLVNIESSSTVSTDAGEGVHRSTHPATAGSFAYEHNFSYHATSDIAAGEEIFISCPGSEDDDDDPGDGEGSQQQEQQQQQQQQQQQSASLMDLGILRRIGSRRPRRDIRWLQENGLCLDDLTVGTSTIAGAGRGAFARRNVKENNVIGSSPVLHFDRSQMDIVAQSFSDGRIWKPVLPPFRDHNIEYRADNVTGKHLLLNYCYGHPDSNLLFLPYGPAVNMINHHAQEANAYIRWSKHALSDVDKLWKRSPDDLLASEAVFAAPTAAASEADSQDEADDGGGVGSTLVVEFVAIRDIAAGEEILIDYGDDWTAAWEDHVRAWPARDHDPEYLSAAEYLKRHKSDRRAIRTLQEQESEPYPDNLRTACYYNPSEGEDDEDGADGAAAGGGAAQESSPAFWTEQFACLCPCDVQSRFQDEATGVTYYYDAIVYPVTSPSALEGCSVDLPEAGISVTMLPANAVTIVDKPYTSDVHLKAAFRREIGVPDGFYSPHWMASSNAAATTDTQEMDEEDFIASPLGHGQIAPIRWSGSTRVVTPWAFRMGLNRHVRKVLIDYCDRMGITDLFRHVTYRDNGLPPGSDTRVRLRGSEWSLHRPEEPWQSNFHWLSPADETTHEHYLQALSAAGWDDMLAAVGRHLNMDGLVAFRVSFMAVSHSSREQPSRDVTRTAGKAYKVIIPLRLVNDTAGSGLDLQEEGWPVQDGGTDENLHVGRYRYENDIAVMMGDDAYHAQAAADYRGGNRMRLVAVIHIADANRNNVDAILNEERYAASRAYPPEDRNLLLSWAGRHWKRDDPTVTLPEPDQDHISSSLAASKDEGDLTPTATPVD